MPQSFQNNKALCDVLENLSLVSKLKHMCMSRIVEQLWQCSHVTEISSELLSNDNDWSLRTFITNDDINTL